MEVPHRETKNVGGLVLIVLAVFALIVIAASGLGRGIFSSDSSVTPVAVKPVTAPATRPVDTPAAPVSPAPATPPKAPSP